MSDAPEIKTDRRGGFRAGAGRPKGARNSRPRAPSHSDAIECSKIEKLLSSHYSGSTKLTVTQLKAIELRYSRLRPTLASIDQTVHDPRDSQDATQLAARLAALFNERPDLFDQVVALKSASASQQPASSSTDQRVSH